MKRKTVCLILFLFFLPSIFLNTAASEHLPLVIDKAGLLSVTEETALEEKAKALQREYGMDVVILTVDSLNGKSAQNYADDYYDRSGYGSDGLLFLLAMSERDWYISTCGDAIDALTDYGIQQLGEQAVGYLSDGDYYGGFDAFLTSLPAYFSAWQNGKPIDGFADESGDYYHGDREETIYYQQPRHVNIWISLVIGAVVGAVVVVIMRASMNTKRSQRSAGTYMQDGSYHLRTHQDLFLYSNVSKVRIQQESSGSSSGGGSSVHHSSSGRSHGGGGGKF